jgi:hypothetical protein
LCNTDRRHALHLTIGVAGSSSFNEEPEGSSRRPRRSDDGRNANKPSRGTAGGNEQQRQGLRGLFFNILRSRFDSNTGSNGGSSSGGYDSPTSIESQLVRREGSMHLPRPADCQVQGTHSDMCIVRVRRNHLVEDALDEIARQYR